LHAEKTLPILSISELYTTLKWLCGAAILAGSLSPRFQATRPCRGECKDLYDASGVNRVAYWNRPSGPLLYVWGWNDVLRAYRLRGSAFDTTPQAKGAIHANFPGGVMTVSADGGREGSGIPWALWAVTPSATSLYNMVAGTRRAFDASDVSHELWNSDQNFERNLSRDLRQIGSTDRSSREGVCADVL
jgi:hypothetical protein